MYGRIDVGAQCRRGSVAGTLGDQLSVGLVLFLLIQLLRFPGVVDPDGSRCWRVRVPSLREVIRSSYRRLLIPGRLLGGMAAVPVLALAWLVTSRPERVVGALIADPVAQSLFAAAGVLLLAVVFRERILIRLETWVYPETAGQREALAAATAELAQAERITAVSRTVTRTVNRCCGSPAALLVKTGNESHAGDFNAPDAKIASLRRASAMVHTLETAGGSLRVHPSGHGVALHVAPAGRTGVGCRRRTRTRWSRWSAPARRSSDVWWWAGASTIRL